MQKDSVLYDVWGRARFDVGIIFSWWDFSVLLKSDMEKFLDEVGSLKNDLRESVFTNRSNPVYVSNNYGELFRTHLGEYNIDGAYMTFYDVTGGTAIWDGWVGRNGNIQAHLNEIEHSLKEFSRGYIHCSDCGKKQVFSEIAKNRYFAGVYCEECWNGKWKEIEAKENYN